MVFTKKMRNVYRRVIGSILLIAICVGLSGCDTEEASSFFRFCKSVIRDRQEERAVLEKFRNYDVDWMVGKTSLEIEQKYGTLHNCYAQLGPDGKYRNGYCRYTAIEGVEEPDSNPHPPTYLKMYFDEAGVCTKAYFYEPPWS